MYKVRNNINLGNDCRVNICHNVNICGLCTEENYCKHVCQRNDK